MTVTDATKGFIFTMPNLYKSLRRVDLKCESDSRAFDQTVRSVIVSNETDRAWFGRPLDNPNCPELEWPKFAWKKVS